MKTAFLLVLPIVLVGTPQDPAALVEQLRADDIAARERAFAQLEKLGATAEDALKRAVAADPRGAPEARRLLRLLELERVFSPALKEAAPGIVRRLANSEGEHWTRIYLELAWGDSRLTRTDLEPLAERAILHAPDAKSKIDACRAARACFHVSTQHAIPPLLRDPGSEVRGAACSTLQDFLGNAAVPVLLKELESEPLLLVEAISNFGAYSAHEAQPRLLELLRHSDPEVVAGAIDCLSSLERGVAIPEIRKLIPKTTPEVKLKAIEFFGQDRVSEAADEVILLLEDPDPSVRAEAVELISNLAIAVPASTWKLLLGDNDPNIVEEALDEIRAEGSAPALGAIKPLLNHPSSEVRKAALRALHLLKDPGLGETAEKWIRDPASEATYAAVEALLSADRARAVGLLREMLLDSDRNRSWRALALDYLAMIRELPGKERLLEVLRGEDKGLAVSVVSAMAESDPELVGPEAARLLADETARRTYKIRDLVGLVEPAKLGPLLVSALDLPHESGSWVVPAMIDRKVVSAIPGLRSLVTGDSPLHQVRAAQALAGLGVAESRRDLAALLKSGDGEVRRAGVDALSRLGLGDEAEDVRRLTGDPDDCVRFAAAAALGRHRVKAAQPDLFKLLDDEEFDVARQAAVGLAALENADATSKMLQWLASPDWNRRNAASEILSVFRPAQARDALPDLLVHRNAQVRESAAELFAAFGMTDQAGRLLPLLGENSTAPGAVESIGVLGARHLIPDLEAILARPEVVARRHALEALVDLEAAEAVPRMRALLHDREVETREIAARGLGRMLDGESRSDLVAMLGDPVRDLRAAAADALGQIGDPVAGAALLARLKEARGSDSVPFIRALGNLRCAEAVPELLRRLKGPTTSESWILVKSLGSIGSKEAVPDLARLLSRNHMIDEVAPALTRLGARETVATLHEALKRTGSGYFESLAGALADLGDPGPIERALAGSARSEREAAARYLCAKGDRRGAPVLLAMNSGIYLDLLNAVRSPGAWKALAETPLRSSLAGNRTRLFERICRVAARKSNLAVGSEYESALWWQEKEFSGAWQESISVQEALMNILERGPRCGQAADAPEFNVILEADEIRIIPGADACAFWKQWWADEQTKTKK